MNINMYRVLYFVKEETPLNVTLLWAHENKYVVVLLDKRSYDFFVSSTIENPVLTVNPKRIIMFITWKGGLFKNESNYGHL